MCLAMYGPDRYGADKKGKKVDCDKSDCIYFGKKWNEICATCRKNKVRHK